MKTKMLTKILVLAAALIVALPAASALAAPKSKFRFSQATYVATEGQGQITATVTRAPRNGHSHSFTNQTSSVNFAITGGSATEGSDYSVSPSPGTLSFGPGETTKTITFTINQDTLVEGLETIQLKLSGASSNALITQPRSAQVLIADDDGPTQVALVAAAPSISEAAGNAVFYAVRSGDITGTSSVDYGTSDGSAVAPDDYTATSGSATFNTAEFSKEIDVPVIDDSAVENSENFHMTLSNVSGAVFPNNASSVSADETIVDNDSQPVFVLDASSYSVSEGGSVDVTVLRHGNASAPSAVGPNDVFTVNWTTTDGTATNPADYVPSADNALEFDSTDDAETITISATEATQIGLVDDTLAEGNEFFTLGISTASPASVGSPSSAPVTIVDNDTAGSNGDNTGNTSNNNSAGSTGGSNASTGAGEGSQIVLGARQAACGLVVKAAKKQRLLKKHVLVLKLRASSACKVKLSTIIKQVLSKKHRKAGHSARAIRFKGKAVSLSLQAGKTKTVKVRFTKKTVKAVAKALRTRKRLVATVVATARSGSAPAGKRTLRVTIRR
jgi:hypothetical protein